MSNVSLQVAHGANCSVRVVRCDEQRSGPIQLMVGGSGTSECDSVIRAIERTLWPAGTQTHVIHVDPEKAADVNALLDEAEQHRADTIFINGRAGEPKRFLLGQVATAVLTRARATVEVVRG
jgi:hypothetical protein